MQRIACGLIATALVLITALVALLLSDALAPGRVPPPQPALRRQAGWPRPGCGHQSERRGLLVASLQGAALRPRAVPCRDEARA